MDGPLEVEGVAGVEERGAVDMACCAEGGGGRDVVGNGGWGEECEVVGKIWRTVAGADKL